MSLLLVWVVLFGGLQAQPPAKAAEPLDSRGVVRVFVLAGQSNMEGKGKDELAEHQASDPAIREVFAHLRRDGRWITRDDVFINYLERRGKLTVGYGTRERTGVELEFGNVVGDHFQEPVLLIKTAWGGHSLFKLFRSPSAGVPEALVDKDLERAQQEAKKAEARGKKRAVPSKEEIRAEYGSSYRKMLAEVRGVEKNLATWFPELAGKRFQISGFVWFQGWNDQYGAENDYADNLIHFIRDVRRDLGAEALPFVIGVMGQNGSSPARGAMLTIQKAQKRVPTLPEFAASVRAVATDVLVDKAAEAFYPHWQERPDEWKKVGGDHPYHYLGSPIWFHRMGRAFAQAMLELLPK